MERANVADVAIALGLQVDRRQSNPRRAICPFHNDKDPSLSLYNGGGHRSHYHCFVCGAHGDAIKLIQTYENLGFLEAVARLAQLMGERVEIGDVQLPDRRLGAAGLVDAIQQASPRARRFTEYAAARGFDPGWLHRAGVAVVSLPPLIERARRDPLLEEALVAAGIARRRDDGDAQNLRLDGLRGFFSGERLVFQINDARGGAAGFAARTLSADVKPKYLYSYGFPRRDILYRADVVADRLGEERSTYAGHPLDCKVAPKRDPGFASKRDPLILAVRAALRGAMA